MDAKYKALKEDFVSNLSGGSVWDINLVTLVAPVSTTFVFDSNRFRLTSRFLGRCSPLVHPTIPSESVHTLHNRGMPHRLPAALRRHPLRHYDILELSSSA